MTPFYFSEAGRRLFAVYDAPSRVRPDALRIVLCYPWAPEYIHAHRSIRRLASLLSAAGHHVMRFDYHGTGDSGGDMTTETLAGWVGDVKAAVAELRNVAGSGGGDALIGLRLGAVLAAQAAAELAGEMKALVLWDPITDGSRYVEELYLACKAPYLKSGGPIARTGRPGGGFEVLGYPLTESLADGIRNVQMDEVAPLLPERTFVVCSGDAAELARMEKSLLLSPIVPPIVEHIPSWPCWQRGFPDYVGAIPTKLLDRITEWVG